jgi:hypothetical protein
MSEVKRWEPRNTSLGYDMQPIPSGSFVLSCDYEALVAQRDEGLAREAELQSEVHRLTFERQPLEGAYSAVLKQNDALQQRLAEAEKLLRKVDMRPAGNIAEVPIYWWNHRNEFLQSCIASPGCADGEPTK